MPAVIIVMPVIRQTRGYSLEFFICKFPFSAFSEVCFPKLVFRGFLFMVFMVV